MGDYAVRMQFDIDADPGSVMQLLTTAEGVEQWWSRPVDGTPGEDGAQFRISFPDMPEPFAFSVQRDGDRTLAWHTQAFPPWWADTTIQWRVETDVDSPGSRLHFAHDGFDPDDAIIPLITPAWAQFIFGLKERAEQAV